MGFCNSAVNIGVSFIGILALVFITPIFYTGQEWNCCRGYYIVYGGPPCSVLGLILSLVVTFSNKCSCCSACCKQPFELGALVVSSPNDAYILAPHGELFLEEKEDDIEEEEEMNKEKESDQDYREEEEQEKKNTESFEMM